MPKSIVGETDLWTTSPHIASMLVDKDIGYRVTKGSHKKADFICPNCGNFERDKIIRKVCTDGLRCSVCSDGISYPEKLMSCVLNAIDVDYIRDSGTKWSGKKRYDFYIEDMSVIIETHGVQHYSAKASFSHHNSRDEHNNDEYKKELAMLNGISHYIELDCRQSDFNYIYNSIMQSDIPRIFDLSNVDWNDIQALSLKSDIIKACDIYNSGVTNTIDIAKMLHLDRSTVIDYLVRSHDAGLCDYTSDKCRPMICVDTGKIYNHLDDVKNDGYNPSQVCACCNNYKHVNTCGGHNWCFLDEYDPETYIMKQCDERGIPKRVLWIETGKIYNRLVDSKKDGFTPSAVSQVCNGKSQHHKHQHFKFVE